MGLPVGHRVPHLLLRLSPVPCPPTPSAPYFSRMCLFESSLVASNAVMCARGKLLTCGCLWISLRRCAARKRKVRQGANSTQVLALAGALANLVLCLLSVGRLGRARASARAQG